MKKDHNKQPKKVQKTNANFKSQNPDQSKVNQARQGFGTINKTKKGKKKT